MDDTPVQLPETEQWLRLPGESNLWYSRFVLFLELGPGRTQLGAVHVEDRQQNRPLTRWTPGSWRAAFKKFRWQERAEAWDEHRRKEVFNRGFASDLVRIEKLDRLAVRLEEKIEAMFQAMKPPKSFSDLLVGRYLEALDALAKETGWRIQRKEVAGPGGGPLEVLLFLPEQERDDPLAGSTYSQDDTIGEDGDLLAGGYDDKGE
jgi:hypothetical protein